LDSLGRDRFYKKRVWIMLQLEEAWEVSRMSVDALKAEHVTALPQSTRDYIFRRMKSVKGYLDPVDALMISTILAAQSNAKLSGSIAEIGVYFGRSFLLMAGLLQPGEHAFAADLFDIGQHPSRESIQLRTFLASGEKLGIAIDRNLVHAGSSRELNARDITSKTGTVRFFNIDGGHLLDDIECDAALAKQAIADFGVLCFDDFCNPEWPEVSLGVFDFLRANTEFAPFALSQKKIFICKNDYVEHYKSVIGSAPVLRKINRLEVDLLGRSVLHLRPRHLERLRYEGLARTGLGRLNAFFY
jgi:Methyltransferase domain